MTERLIGAEMVLPFVSSHSGVKLDGRRFS